MPATRATAPMARATVALAAALAGLAACELAPPDGRDLGLRLSGMPSELAVGDQAAVTIEVTNHGDATATGSLVAVVAPAAVGVEAVMGATSCPVVEIHDGASQLLRCDVGDLAAGAASVVELTLTGVAPTDAAAIGVVAGSGASEPSPDLHPNQASEVVAVVGAPAEEADLGLEPHDPYPDPPPAGVARLHAVRVRNAGPGVAEGIELTVTFPDSVVVTAHEEPGQPYACTMDGQEATCSVSPLGPGASRDVYFSVTHLTFDEAVTFTASVTSGTPEAPDGPLPNTIEWVRTAEVGYAHLRVRFLDQWGQPVALLPGNSVRVFTATDTWFPSYVAKPDPPYSPFWWEVDLPPGAYRVQVELYQTGEWAWLVDQPTRALADELVAEGLSERWEFDVPFRPSPPD